jgi:hypothetical protein
MVADIVCLIGIEDHVEHQTAQALKVDNVKAYREQAQACTEYDFVAGCQRTIRSFHDLYARPPLQLAWYGQKAPNALSRSVNYRCRAGLNGHGQESERLPWRLNRCPSCESNVGKQPKPEDKPHVMVVIVAANRQSASECRDQPGQSQREHKQCFEDARVIANSSAKYPNIRGISWDRTKTMPSGENRLGAPEKNCSD